MKKISISVPCYNEKGNVREMAETLVQIASELPYEYEILFTDNCSADGTQDILRELAKEDQHIKVIINNRNYGADGRSSRNAMRYLNGDAIIALPCDFQEPPELIPELIHYWEQGYKIIYGQKTASKEGRLKYACRTLFYHIIGAMSESRQYEHISGISLFDREVVDQLLQTDDEYALRFMLGDMGYDVKLIPYEQRARKSGRSSYNVWRYFDFAIHTMTLVSTFPLRVMTIAGIFMTGLSFLTGLIYLVLKLVIWNSLQLDMAPVLIGMFFLGSVQILFLGLIGEYVGIISKRVIKKPGVIVKETINLDDVPIQL